MIKTKKSIFIIILVCILPFIFVLLRQDTNVADAATQTYLFDVKYDYTHFDVVNNVESQDGSGSNVLTSSLSSTKTAKANLSFQMYGDSFSTSQTFENGGFINSSSIHIAASTSWPSSEMKVKDSSGNVKFSGTSSVAGSLEDGTYYLEYIGIGTGWLTTAREYEYYKVIATFAFKVDTKKPTISNALENVLYTNETVTISSVDSFSGIDSMYVKSPSQSSYSRGNSSYTIYKTDANGLYSFYAQDKAGNTSNVYYVYLDTIAPEVNFKLNGDIITSSFINKVPSIYASDNQEVYKLYLIEDGVEKEINLSYQIPSLKQVKVYAVDRAGNKSIEKTIYVDTTLPSLSIYASNEDVTNKTIVSSISGIRAVAKDTESNVKAIYFKKDGDKNYSIYDGSNLTNDATYYFYAEDNAGNLSKTLSIKLDNTKPTFILYEGENVLKSAYSASNYIKYYAEDSSGIKESYFLKNGEKYSYTLLTQIKDEGKYEIYSVDNAGNISEACTVYLDRTIPSCLIYVDDIYSYPGCYNSSNIVIKGYDKVSGVKEITYTYGKDKFTYNGEVLFSEGAYSFYVEDNAGNVSDELYFIIDRTKPEQMIFTSDGECNPKYTSVSFNVDSMDNVSINKAYVKEANNVEYREYIYGETFIDGEYYFYCEDDALNKSDVIKIIVDTIAPKVSVYAIDQEILPSSSTSKSIRFNAVDSNEFKTYVLLPSSTEYIEYTLGNILQEEGKYSFYAEDLAKNKSSVITVTVDKSAPVLEFYKGDEKTSSTAISKTMKIKAIDTYSSSYIFVKIPGDSKFSKYDGEELKIDGEYYVYAVDSVDNKSEVKVVVLDNDKPIGKLYQDGEVINSAYINRNYFEYRAEDNTTSISKMFVYEGASLREYYGEKIFLDGKYTFYSLDEAGNKSEEILVTLDRVNPYGEIHFESSYKVCNVPFYFSAFDDVEIDRILYKTPSSSWNEYQNNQYIVDLENGEYKFYVIDKAGNESSIYKLNVDIIPPIGQIVVNDYVFSSYYLNQYFKYVTESVATSYVKYPDGNYVEYFGDTISPYSSFGEYSFYSIDEAGNISEIVSVFLDNLLPEGNIYSGTKVLKNNQYTTESISFKGIKRGSEIVNTFVLIDGFETLYSGEVFSNDATYSFYAEDEAGNRSLTYTCTIDTIKPTCEFYVNGVLSKDKYTNKDRISLKATDKNLKNVFVKLPGENDYGVYSNNSMYSEEGKYTFYAEDLAGNKSSEYVIYIDRKPKEVEVVSLNGNVATDNVYIKAKENDLAPIKAVTINDIPYTLLDTIYIVNNGEYRVKVIDEAGNAFELSFTASKETFKDRRTVIEYYESKGIDNKLKSFASFESALENAFNKESMNVEFMSWQNQEWDLGIEMDKEDSVNATQGLVYIYKDENNEGKKVAYFTESRLFAVINKYAEKDVKHYYYYEKQAVTENAGVYLNEYVSSEMKLDKNLTYIIDGFLVSGTAYSKVGRHEVTVIDKYKNLESYIYTIIDAKPEIYYSILGGEKYQLKNNEYYLKDDVTINIKDIDEDAILVVRNDKNEIIYRVKNNEEIVLSTGRYYIQTINHLGISTQKIIHVSKNKADIKFEELLDSKKLKIEITPSKDLDSKIQSVYIYKLIDGAYEKVLKDDYSTYITKTNYIYYFRTSYEYLVEVEDNFRSGIDMVSKKYIFKKALPEIQITNIETGYTNKNVEVKFSDEAYVELYKNGEKIEFSQGIIKDEGVYNLYYKDYDNNETLFVFEIDKKTPIVYLDGVEENSVTNQSVRIKCFEENVDIKVYKDFEEYLYDEGDLIKEDGFYEYILTDMAKNITTGSFTIDKLINIELNTLDGGISSEDVIIEAFETLDVEVKLNNESISYNFGEKLTNEGNYSVYLKDTAENEKTISFSIQKSKLKTFDLNTLSNLKVLEVSKDNIVEDINSPLIFKEDGIYKITLSNGDKQTNFTIIIDTTAPIVSLTGVQNGGTTKGEVKISYISEECKILGYLNGYFINVTKDTIFKDQGVYTLYFQDEVGNESIINFEIKEGANRAVIVLIILIFVFALVITIFALIFKKKNKKIKELSLKKEFKDEKEEKEDRHILKPIEIKKDTESLEAQKEIEDRDIALLSLSKGNLANIDELRVKSNKLNEGLMYDPIEDEKEKYYESIDYKELMKNLTPQEKKILKINSFIEDDNYGLIPCESNVGGLKDG